MWRAIEKEADQPAAMYREETGPIDFAWIKQTRNGEYGIKHILDRRAEQDSLFPERNRYSPEELCAMIPDVIVFGVPKNVGRSVELDYLGVRCVIAKKRDGNNSWLLTAKEEWPDKWKRR